MPKPPRIEKLLAHWIVDPVTWRRFVQAVEAHGRLTHIAGGLLKIREAPPEGIQVVVQDDVVCVGKESFCFWNGEDNVWVTLRESWLEFSGFPVPVPDHARAEAARIADYFTQLLAELERAQAEERARPTISNRLLNVVERHFILCLLLFFFVLIPAFVGLVVLLSRWFPWLTDIES